MAWSKIVGFEVSPVMDSSSMYRASVPLSRRSRVMLSSQSVWPRSWSFWVAWMGSRLPLGGGWVWTPQMRFQEVAALRGFEARLWLPHSTPTAAGPPRAFVIQTCRPTCPRLEVSMNQLQSIARRAMIERGLLPDFSPAALAETDAITKAPRWRAPRDPRPPRPPLGVDRQRHSRDLDQLSVSAPATGGA